MTEYASGEIDLASPEAGGAVLSVSDDFFAPVNRMLSTGAPRFIPGLYDTTGKWMDGWESRRRRDSGHDHCVLRIRPGVVRRLVIDTRHFIGNYPAAASVDACHCDVDPTAETAWQTLLERQILGPDRAHEFRVSDDRSWTHLRLNIFPDGGIARFRVPGVPDFGMPDTGGWIDLLAGGQALYCNDMHFGHMDNLLAPQAPASMADGWETRRRRDPGNDFAVLRLGTPGRVRGAWVDTAFFRGNYPARCSLRATRLGDAGPGSPEDSADWPVLLPELALAADHLHRFDWQLCGLGPVDHVRLDIYPDGGVARLRLLGVPEP